MVSNLKGKISKVSEYTIKNPSAIREIMTIVTDYKLHPEKYPRELIYLAGGWPQDAPPSTLREALSEVIEDDNVWVEASRYGATRGQPEFIEGLAEYEKVIFGRRIYPEEVFVGGGSTELTATIMTSILDPGDEVILTRPSYLNYERQLQIETRLDIKIKRWDIIRNYEFNPSVDNLQNIISNDTKLIFITTPGNPDSQVFDDETIEAVVDIAEDKGIWVVIDVAYRAFIFGNYPRYMSRSRRENEIWIATLSKEFRIPGWRISYLLLDQELLKAVETIEQARLLCPSRLVQETLTKLFYDRDKLERTKLDYEETRKKYANIANYTYEYLVNNIEGLRPIKPTGGFYVFFDASRYFPSSKELCSSLMNEYQVALVPGFDFGMEGWIRLSFAPLVNDKEKLEEGLGRIKEFFDSRKG